MVVPGVFFILIGLGMIVGVVRQAEHPVLPGWFLPLLGVALAVLVVFKRDARPVAFVWFACAMIGYMKPPLLIQGVAWLFGGVVIVARSLLSRAPSDGRQIK